MSKCYSNRHIGLINVSCLKVTAQSRQLNQHLLLVNEIDVNAHRTVIIPFITSDGSLVFYVMTRTFTWSQRSGFCNIVLICNWKNKVEL